MEGVIVHAEHTVREMPVVATVCICLLLFAMYAFILYGAYMEYTKDKDKKCALTLVVVFIFTLIFPGVLGLESIRQSRTVYNEKIVTVDESVGFNEFFRRFKIVSQDGSLYTVIEYPVLTEEDEVGGDE